VTVFGLVPFNPSAPPTLLTVARAQWLSDPASRLAGSVARALQASRLILIHGLAGFVLLFFLMFANFLEASPVSGTL